MDREVGVNRGWPEIDARGSGLRTTRVCHALSSGSQTILAPLIFLIGMLLTLAPWAAPAQAQIFLASKSKPEFEIGPLSVRASVAPKP